MIRPSNNSLNVYLYSEPVDMRKAMNGLATIVEHHIPAKLFSKSLFVFTNKRRDKLKILYWEKTGFVVWYKSLEKEKFRWFKGKQSQVVSVKELNMLLDGYDIFNFKPHRPLSVEFAA